MKISIRLLARPIIITLSIILFTATAPAQTNRGGITGTVFDKTGAVIPGATVIVTNIGTNESLRLSTSESGNFSAPSLNPVEYRLTVEAGGFRKAVVDKVKVDTATTATVDVTLEPGEATAEITVTAEAPLLNTASGTPGKTITERQIVEMPLNNRSVLDLVLTVPGATGVAGTEDPELSSGAIPVPGYNVNINGGRAGSTSILADGARNTGVGLGRAIVTFSPDTVQEFTVQTSNFSAEYGQTGGGIVNLTTKSGTNQYNGLGYWYHRNPSLNAAPFTINANNRPESLRRQHQFGLIFGGPVQLPKKVFGPLGYDGHDKTFFFVAVEPRYYYDSSPFTALLPTPAMMRGDFSNVVGVNGGYAPRDVAERFGLQAQFRDATIYNQWIVNGNRFTRIILPQAQQGQPAPTYNPFPGNRIPENMLDPVSLSLLKYLPTPGDYFLADGNLRNYQGSNFIKDMENRMTVRIDHQLSNNNRLTGRYTQVPIRGDRGRGDFQIGRDEINSGGTDYSWAKQVLLTDTHTFSSSLINELSVNYTYGRFTRNLPPMFDALTGRNFSAEIGLPSITAGGLPEITTGVGSIGFSQSQQNENTEHSYEITNTVSWVRGSQTWKFGVNLLQQRLKTIPLFGASGGRYEFNRNRTLTNNNTSGTATGVGGIEFAQFLMGTYNLATLRDVLIPYYYQWNSAAGFAQNSWKVRPNLTLELGMRYSLQLPRTEKYDHQGMFLPELAKEFPLQTPVTLPDGRVISTALVIPFGYSGRGGRSRYIFPVEKNGFEPRFGFSWLPKIFGMNDSGRLVIRGGYGLYHAPLTGTNRNPSPDFASGATEYGAFDQRVENPGMNVAARICCNRPVLRQQSPDQFLNIPEDGLLYLPGINIAANAVSPNAHIPYVQSWSASVAYELQRNTVLEFSYRGSKGTHLFLPPTRMNPVPADVSEIFLSRGLNPFNPPVPDPLGRQTPNGNVIQYGPAYLGTKYLGYTNLSMQYDSSANSIYHAGTVSMERRLNKGLTYTANYTFAKSLDDASDSGDVRFVNSNTRSPGYVNLGAPRYLDRSVSLFDIKHAFSATFLYDLPFGRGRSFLARAPGVVEGLVGGWSLSGVGRIQGGLPMVLVLRDDNGLGILNGNLRTIRPDVVPGVPLINPRWSRDCPIGQLCEPYFNPAAFMRPIKGELGTAPRTFDSARGPTTHTLDLSVQKNFPIGKDGKRRLQIRVDAINVLNHPIFRIGAIEDAGEIFAAPTEGTLSNGEYDAWAAAAPGRPARTTPAGAALMAQINQIVINNRIPGSQSLRRDFFRVRVPEGFFSMNANSFDITTLEGLQLYRLRQAYMPERWGFLNVTSERSGYSPRFIQIALKFYF
jgi:hypothetical protein